MLSIGLTLKGNAIHAGDGNVGVVSDFLFDDTSWMVRWLVVDAGSWFAGHKVLIHPSSIGHVDHALRIVDIRLTKAQINGAPSIASDEPVSRQMQYSLYGYYGFDPLWGGGGAGTGMGCYGMGLPFPPGSYEMDAAQSGSTDKSDEGDPHLRSIEEVAGYQLQALDGPIGHIENFLLDEANWCIRYLVVKTANWWTGQHVLISPYAVRKIEWLDHSIELNVSRSVIKGSPAWLPNDVDSPSYQRELHNYYGWPAHGAHNRVLQPQS